MTDTTTHGSACSLEGRAFQERLTWIAELNRKHLRRAQRQGTTLMLTYGPAAQRDVEALMSREQECCAFLEFRITHSSEEVRLDITVPDHASQEADALLAPFQGGRLATGATECCGTCSVPVSPIKAARIAGVATATSATAVIACGACCLLPLAFPAVAATAIAGGLLGWLAGAHVWLTVLAVVAVVGAWLWVWRQSVKHKARLASSTLGLMGLASLVLVLALAWPQLEPKLMAWFL
ncbi:hypothetical protein [Rhodanobacter thiooxydans]|uniref:hypothetical protein n=1 Tax=Rhodanobacter thiooxydans TaxID=416169 RepID=UPI00131ED1A3|nr:hypothetical protein [Rhodanobacter thiooxydans]